MSSSSHGVNAMTEIRVAPLKASPQVCAALSEILIEAVASGGSVRFMHPLAMETADSFWRDSLAAADRGERIVLGAFDGERLVGTVTLLLSLPPNQPHRAELAKMMTRISHRGRGVATTLMAVAERLAAESARPLPRKPPPFGLGPPHRAPLTFATPISSGGLEGFPEPP